MPRLKPKLDFKGVVSLCRQSEKLKPSYKPLNSGFFQILSVNRLTVLTPYIFNKFAFPITPTRSKTGIDPVL